MNEYMFDSITTDQNGESLEKIIENDREVWGKTFWFDLKTKSYVYSLIDGVVVLLAVLHFYGLWHFTLASILFRA